jgi:hypothetical protein
MDRSAIAARKPEARSKVTNGKLTPFGDGRSSQARRYRDLDHEFAAKVGRPWDTLPESTRQTIRSLAAVSVRLEQLGAQRLFV